MSAHAYTITLTVWVAHELRPDCIGEQVARHLADVDAAWQIEAVLPMGRCGLTPDQVAWLKRPGCMDADCSRSGQGGLAQGEGVRPEA